MILSAAAVVVDSSVSSITTPAGSAGTGSPASAR
jgi:hypothetical protein